MNNISIVGGGIGGLSAALALGMQGIQVTVYERQPEYSEAGAGIVIGANAMKALDYLGIADKVRQFSYCSDECTILSDLGKEITSLTYQSDSFPTYTLIHRYDLIRILAEALPPECIVYNKKLVKLIQNKNSVLLHFEDGASVTTDYVIGSDGIHSKIRNDLLPEKKLRFAGYSCWRGILEDCPDYIPKTFSETWGPRGRFGIVPLNNDRIYWYAVKNSQANDPDLMNWKTKDLLFNFFYYHDPIPQIIEKTLDKNIIFHDIYDLDPLFQYTFGNILLIGDAAHATTPNLGQGACQAIEDALYLSLHLKKEQTFREAFIEYEKQRITRIRKIVQDSWTLGKVAQIDIPILCTIRNQMMKLAPSSIQHKRLKNIFELDHPLK